MEKTISHLNDKAWYRLIKVVYILFFVISLVGLNLGNYFGNGIKKVDLEKTQIQCNFQDKKNFSPKSIYLNFSLDVDDFINEKFDYEHFFRGYYNEYKIKDILKKCYTSDIDGLDVFVLQRHYEITGVKEAKKEYTQEYLDSEIKKIESGYKTNDDKIDLLDFSIKFFDIKPVFSYSYFITFFIIGNLSIILFFELIKRIFYYVVLGTIRPKK